jgi:hypothetical protein
MVSLQLKQIVLKTCWTQSVFSSHAAPFIPASSPALSIKSALVQTTIIGTPAILCVKVPWPRGNNGPVPYTDEMEGKAGVDDGEVVFAVGAAGST